MNVMQGLSLVINVPDLFKQPDFVAWLNDTSRPKFTWHTPGATPAEYSDVIVLVDPGLEEGSDQDMPGWDSVIATVREHIAPHSGAPHICVRLTNLVV